MKYEIGDFVSKPVTGICKIENILYLNPQDEKNDKLYYLMKPVEDEKEKIYVPVSSSDSRLRSHIQLFPCAAASQTGPDR